MSNREIAIRLRKAKPKTGEEEELEIRKEKAIFEDKVELFRKVGKDLLRTALIGICVYVVLDTSRQVVVNKTTSSSTY
jgi:hypothetical protein